MKYGLNSKDRNLISWLMRCCVAAAKGAQIGRQATRGTKFCTLTLNICGSSVLLLDSCRLSGA